jgi:riboflavin transporter FmnP
MALGVLVGTMIGQLAFGFAVRLYDHHFLMDASKYSFSGMQADWLGKKLMFIATLVMIILFSSLSALSFSIDGKVLIIKDAQNQDSASNGLFSDLDQFSSL